MTSEAEMPSSVMATMKLMHESYSELPQLSLVTLTDSGQSFKDDEACDPAYRRKRKKKLNVTTV